MCGDCGCQGANFVTRNRAAGSPDLLFKNRLRQKNELTFVALESVSELDSEKLSRAQVSRHTLEIGEKVLAKNDAIAARNRRWFAQNGVRVLNLMSSPGAGKTRLLEKTLERVRDAGQTVGFPSVAILTGDQERDFDAQRLLNRGARVKQINTHSSCHLDAAMIERELGDFITPETDLLIIENVGNLVCPAAFDLGESERVALLSTTEGEDKPAKYPLLFHRADWIVITKVDLRPHLEWSLEECQNHIRSVNSEAEVLLLSSKSGEGMDRWMTDVLAIKGSVHPSLAGFDVR